LLVVGVGLVGLFAANISLIGQFFLIFVPHG
jgi:hypothetical protein